MEGKEFRVPRPHAFTRRAYGGATGLTQLQRALTRAAPGKGSTRRITVPVTGNSPKSEGKPLLRRRPSNMRLTVLFKGASPVLLLEDLHASEHNVSPRDWNPLRLLHQKLHLQLDLGPRLRNPYSECLFL